MLFESVQKIVFSALVAGFSAAQASQIGVTTVVDGHAGPWLQSLNPTFNYGVQDNVGPDVINSAYGFSFAPGGTFTVTYLDGCVTFGGFGCSDANGNHAYAANNNGGSSGLGFPSRYMSPYPIYLVALVGTFADNGVITGTPFALGDGPTSVTVPAGANELLLGVNDDEFGDNGGFLQVRIAGPSGTRSATPEPVSFLSLGGGLCGIAFWRFRRQTAGQQKGK